MKILATAAAVVLILAPLALARTGQNTGRPTTVAEDDIKALLRQWDEAYEQRNPEPLSRILADDFTLTDTSGAVLNRAQYVMSIVKSPDFSRIKSFASEDVKVVVTGNRAVVTGRSAVKGAPRGRGQAFGGTYRFTDTWMLQDGVWKAVSSKTTTAGPASMP